MYKSKYKKVVVLSIRTVKFNVSSFGLVLKRNNLKTRKKCNPILRCTLHKSPSSSLQSIIFRNFKIEITWNYAFTCMYPVTSPSNTQSYVWYICDYNPLVLIAGGGQKRRGYIADFPERTWYSSAPSITVGWLIQGFQFIVGGVHSTTPKSRVSFCSSNFSLTRLSTMFTDSSPLGCSCKGCNKKWVRFLEKQKQYWVFCYLRWKFW